MLSNIKEEAFVLTEKEMDRLSVIRCVVQRKLTWLEAARQLNLSKRQIGNLVARFRQEGSRGILHRLKGKPSNHRLVSGLLDRALALVKSKYPDFGPTFACEKLQENHGVSLSRETLRQAMIRTGIRQVRTRQPKHRSWRPRRLCVGELVQLDASYHDWLEGRAPECALINYIDDATGKILYAEFIDGESAITLLKTTKTYLLRWGRPKAFYVDKHAVFHVNKQTMVEPHLREPQSMTQYTRAMAELGIEIVTANSPQAKGRVERSFKTLQDRLIKEMRLQGICSVAIANEFLWKEFILDYNRRFAVEPASAFNAHRALLLTHNLDRILSLKTERRLMNDFTISFKGQKFQLLKEQPIRLVPKDKALVEVRLNGSIHLFARGEELRYKPIVPEKLWWEKAYPELVRAPRNYDGPFHPVVANLPNFWQASSFFELLKRTPLLSENGKANFKIPNHGKRFFLRSNDKLDGFSQSGNGRKLDFLRNGKENYLRQKGEVSILQKG